MALASNCYVTLEDVKKSLELTGTSFANRDLERAIASASRAVDKVCDRRFWLDEDPVTRTYTASGMGDRVSIDDLPDVEASDPGALATVEIRSGDEWETLTWDDDYEFAPINAHADGEPFTDIISLGRLFPVRMNGVRVTARWGWAEIPHQVVQATVLLSNRLLIRARQAPFGVVIAGVDVGVAMRIARQDPDVMGLLAGVSRVPAMRSVQLS